MSCLGDFKTAPECYVVMTLQMMMMMIIKRYADCNMPFENHFIDLLMIMDDGMF